MRGLRKILFLRIPQMLWHSFNIFVLLVSFMMFAGLIIGWQTGRFDQEKPRVSGRLVEVAVPLRSIMLLDWFPRDSSSCIYKKIAFEDDSTWMWWEDMERTNEFLYVTADLEWRVSRYSTQDRTRVSTIIKSRIGARIRHGVDRSGDILFQDEVRGFTGRNPRLSPGSGVRVLFDLSIPEIVIYRNNEIECRFTTHRRVYERRPPQSEG